MLTVRVVMKGEVVELRDVFRLVDSNLTLHAHRREAGLLDSYAWPHDEILHLDVFWDA